ncbi:serine/threonine-protein kinase SRK2J isoform X2 [Glycine max]|uniref:Uncharacterized protein n=1 Tax=Glycine max TaxID=3847 RepID=K7MHL8_SOYBN|nr:serine/threonine-protein kinase SRK2J isoform X2 [Glycine max]|eukprot:XP_014624053.1 serine/threonine-protein kinase SRK2J isoform X2 [Glycine max]
MYLSFSKISLKNTLLLFTPRKFLSVKSLLRAQQQHTPSTRTKTCFKLVGELPFVDKEDTQNLHKTVKTVMAVQYKFPDKVCISSEDSKNLISRIFVANPAMNQWQSWAEFLQVF